MLQLTKSLLSKISLVPNKLTANPKQLFLIDGIGALVSAFFLGIVLVRLESSVGMPKNVLYFLAVLPCLFAVYSFYCHFLLKHSWHTFLKGIAIANLSYCVLTVSLLFIHYERLTFLGLFYFLVELVIIGILVTFELRASSKHFEQRA